MNKVNTPFFIGFFIFCGIMVLRSIYKTFIKKALTPQDYMKKANYAVSFFKAKDYAYKTLQKALDTFENMTTEEKSFINFQMGLVMFQKKNLQKATEHFEIAWPYFKKAKIPYNKIYSSLVISFYKIGEKEKAREIYHFLRQKEKYDPRFSDLSFLDNIIFK